MALTGFRAFMARIEALEETQASQPDPAMALWLSALSDLDLERLIEILRRAQQPDGLFTDAEIDFYTAIVSTAPPHLFPMTGE